MSIRLKKLIKENEFFGAPAGGGGVVNYGHSLGTYASPNSVQDPAHFGTGGTVGSNSNTADTTPSASLEPQIDQAFEKPVTPTPDDVITGLRYEMGRMIKKDPRKAKELVVQNLLKDPKYYTNLKMMNIDDEDMMKENVEETRKILDQMFETHVNKKYDVNSNILDAIRDTQKKFDEKNSWRRKQVIEEK